MEDEIVVKEEATEDQVKEEVEIKQEVVMGDEDVEEEVGNRWAVEDEGEGDLMIKREDCSTDPLGEESDVLERSSGVQRAGWRREVTTSSTGYEESGVKTVNPSTQTIS
ncbi:hypothetical protein GE061_016995 [Apolygus lucorum]|uniref:Uncharacterized protein n=1 Tax=Apolygus lucorum TaxID=248454 RepID=A0A8S9XHU0_APOLU|nr:hypothetical protein GE061_016995 [Apolygus lucorum]